MNNQVKILLTINGIEGATLHRGNEEKFSTVIRIKDISKKHKTEDENRIVRKIKYKHSPLIVVPASKQIKLTLDAYEYMISNNIPEGYFKKNWQRLKPQEKLEYHLDIICKHNNGTSFSYSILED